MQAKQLPAWNGFSSRQVEEAPPEWCLRPVWVCTVFRFRRRKRRGNQTTTGRRECDF